MSVCFNHVRRTLGSSAHIRQRICMTTSPISPIISSDPTTTITLPIRHFAAAATKKSKKSDASGEDDLSHQERKDAAKQKRRETWDKHQQRLESLNTRRDDSPKDVKRTPFRSWWDKEVMYHNVLTRHARQAGKPWRIRVAVMVERIPIVQPDTEEWEREYFALRDYLWSYGKEYTEDTGFMYAPDKPEDHIIPTDEEMLAGLPFTPAPRETEADATGNIQTRDRQLKTSVFLTLKTDAEGNKSGPRWTLPSALATNNETLLETAQRAVSESVGNDLTLWCPSNAPMAVNFRVYNKNVPEEVKQNYYGEKIFYYRVQHDQGDVDENTVKKNAEDWGWLAKDEVADRVEGERGVHQAKFFRYML